MFEKATSGRDAFTFSLRGISVISLVAAPQAIADDRINRAWDEKFKSGRHEQPGTPSKRGAATSSAS